MVTSTSCSGANMRTTSNECDTKCLLWKCRLPSNIVKNDQLGHVLQYCKHLKLVNMFTTRPMLRDHITLPIIYTLAIFNEVKIPIVNAVMLGG